MSVQLNSASGWTMVGVSTFGRTVIFNFAEPGAMLTALRHNPEASGVRAGARPPRITRAAARQASCSCQSSCGPNAPSGANAVSAILCWRLCGPHAPADASAVRD